MIQYFLMIGILVCVVLCTSHNSCSLDSLKKLEIVIHTLISGSHASK